MNRSDRNQRIEKLLHTIKEKYRADRLRPAAERGRRRQLYLAAASFACFLTAVFSLLFVRYSEETLSGRISPQVLRFHVLANSDSAADQDLKLNVKQMLIDTMYADLKSEGAFSGVPLSKERMSAYILSNEEELEKKAEDFMAAQGYPYPADLRLERTYFPTKRYGDVVFPCGTYDAVRVLLGEGEGKNWWCVLYPPLCFTDNAYAVVPDSSKKELENLLPEADFRDLMRNRRVVFGDGRLPEKEEGTQTTVRVRSLLLELIQK